MTFESVAWYILIRKTAKRFMISGPHPKALQIWADGQPVFFFLPVPVMQISCPEALPYGRIYWVWTDRDSNSPWPAASICFSERSFPPIFPHRLQHRTDPSICKQATKALCEPACFLQRDQKSCSCLSEPSCGTDLFPELLPEHAFRNSQAVAAFFSASGENLSSVFRGHSRTKSVGSDFL